MNFKKYYNLDQSKFYRDPLFILVSITTVLTLYLLSVQMKIGVPYFDVFNYLNNGLYFAGMGNGKYLYLPPFIPILNAIFFKMGYISINIIFIISSILFIIGVLGLYLLFNERFNKIQSFTGSIIFISFPIMISWAASGGIDIPGITFSIWAIYITVLGVKKDSRFLYLVLPIIMLSFITRYTSGLMLLPALFYVVINIKYIKNVKKIILGIILELIALIGAFLALFVILGTINKFFGLLIYVFTDTKVGIGDVAYNPNALYYIHNILNYISISPLQGTYSQILSPANAYPSILSYIIALIVLIGIVFYIYRIWNSKSMNIDKQDHTIKIILLSVLIISFIIAIYTVSFFISEILLFLILCILYSLLKSSQSKNLDLDLMFLSWFGAYLIFHSNLPIKADRYFITMAPAFAYFIILGLSEFIEKFKPKIKNKNLRSWGVYSIIALIFLSSSITIYIDHTPKKCYTLDIEDACNWLKEYDPNYGNKIISSDYQPAVSWYLKSDVIEVIPVFRTTTKEFSKLLQSKNVDYFIDCLTNPKRDIKGYHIIKRVNNIAIYEKNI